ncbi:hypothetical protein HY639_04045 [Candidatus Woesearchaeota archaeon]|nr:hypothetical protein [Candidatus Woesearchaeota archaeon]
MDHVAIMKKSWKLIDKIISGHKRIESRWYMACYPPWNRIQAGDTVYFKDAGELVSAKARVQRVLQFDHYNEQQLTDILCHYGGDGGICFHTALEEVFIWAGKRKYCILIFLENAQRIVPFAIDKTGYGNACAWICVPSIDDIKAPQELSCTGDGKKINTHALRKA